MLDAALLRNDLDAVILGLAKRGVTFDRDTFQRLESERKRVIQQAEALKAERNRVSDEVARMKRAKENADALIAAQREVGDRLKGLEAAEKEAEAAFRAFLATLPNLPHESVPVGRDEQANVEIKRWGTPPAIEKPLDHVDLGTRLGILDLDRAAKLSGARFAVLKGLGAKLERALVSFMADLHGAGGWSEILPPYLVLPECMYGTGQLPKFEQDLFKTYRGEDALYLIPTAEVPVTNLYREEILPGDQLPIRHFAFTPCFRSEAGSYGRDTKGIIRQHQFHKVELVSLQHPGAGPGGAGAPHRQRRAGAGGAGAALPARAALLRRHGRRQPQDLRPRGVAAQPGHLPGDQLLLLDGRLPGPARQHPLPPRGRQAAVPEHPQRQRPGRGPDLGGHPGERTAARRQRARAQGAAAVPGVRGDPDGSPLR